MTLLECPTWLYVHNQFAFDPGGRRNPPLLVRTLDTSLARGKSPWVHTLENTLPPKKSRNKIGVLPDSDQGESYNSQGTDDT